MLSKQFQIEGRATVRDELIETNRDRCRLEGKGVCSVLYMTLSVTIDAFLARPWF